MELKKTAREFKDCVDEVMEKCKKKLAEELIDDSDMTDESDWEMLMLMKDMFRLCDVSMKLVCKQAETIQVINDKLDKLLEKTEEKES